MANGDAAMDQMIANLRALPRAVRSEIMPEFSRLTRELIRQSVGGQRSPDGQAWKPTKDGSVPLKNAADSVSIATSGLVLVATLDGPEVFHHYGTKRTPRRPILPTTNGIPATLKEAFKTGAIRILDKRLKKAVSK